MYFLDVWGPFTLDRYKPAVDQDHPVANWEERELCLVWYEDIRVVSLRHKPGGKMVRWAKGWDQVQEWPI